ncbi:hypothetical protein GALMADRAFT_1271467 [Galerina marginata CBS 339.88]|uniref:Uncharacterized protein n=1 Tax=Galerina marginata (strain CBS 339.88) TaxID=685588 RepID=A0A067T6I9_GALM3|nr:hypothetical protein GALMADRAFT_1271467 [Galerina marginata CBS 339.88]
MPYLHACLALPRHRSMLVISSLESLLCGFSPVAMEFLCVSTVGITAAPFRCSQMKQAEKVISSMPDASRAIFSGTGHWTAFRAVSCPGLPPSKLEDWNLNSATRSSSYLMRCRRVETLFRTNSLRPWHGFV